MAEYTVVCLQQLEIIRLGIDRPKIDKYIPPIWLELLGTIVVGDFWWFG